MKYFFMIVVGIFFIGCSFCNENMCAPREEFIKAGNNLIGRTLMHNKPYKYKTSGQTMRSGLYRVGQGFTHITKSGNGDLIYHFDRSEIFPRYWDKSMVGKCKTYYIVDSKTLIVKGWGYEKDANPKSCVAYWP
jgi:hypothetical protein